MADVADEDVVAALLERHGRTYAEELGIDVGKNTPSPLFRLLCASVLMSARISASIATDAARALAEHGWRTAAKLAGSTWDERVEALHSAGVHALPGAHRDDARRARRPDPGPLPGRPAQAARRGGLRPAGRAQAAQGVQGARRRGRRHLLPRGAGGVGDELRPFADRRALDAAGRLGLPKDPEALAELGGDAYPRLVAALVRVELDDDDAAVREAARSR